MEEGKNQPRRIATAALLVTAYLIYQDVPGQKMFQELLVLEWQQNSLQII